MFCCDVLNRECGDRFNFCTTSHSLFLTHTLFLLLILFSSHNFSFSTNVCCLFCAVYRSGDKNRHFTKGTKRKRNNKDDISLRRKML